ncbi:MAG TPA: peptidylprolyl isomerase [Gammaproteobacteria bacterium]|nr:peptidylprolyl isomerase [Gammaproteobacteria bacterium]
MKIGTHAVMSMHYVLTDGTGEEIDSSTGQEPLTYLHGTGHLIPGLERELDGKEAGDELIAVISPEDGYGEQDETLIRQIPRTAFGDIENIEPGMQFRAGGNDDDVQIITVTKVEGDDVTVDGNHPLAGMTLNFSVSIQSVREASSEEIDHGHVR